MKNINIYTDGACSGNPGPGGWAALLIWEIYEKEIYGGSIKTTNNRMEILAAVNALKILKEPCCINLYTDSNYLNNGINKWIKIWKNNGWKTSSKKCIKNIKLWQMLDLYLNFHIVKCHWIKAHSENKKNNRVDIIARKMIKFFSNNY